MRRWLRTLGGRSVVTATIVAIIAVLVTAAAALPLVSTAVDNQVRRQLTAEAVALAASSPARLNRAVAASAPGGIRIAVVQPDGTMRGPAAGIAAALPSVPGDAAATVAFKGRTYEVVSRTRPGGGAVIVAQRMDDVQQTSRAIMLAVLVALLVGLAVAVAAGALLARMTVRPLRATAEAARRIAHGERQVVVPASPQVTEVDDIATALRTLDAALTTSEARQREFLLSVSHELRTPLAAARGYAEALADGMIAPDEMTAVGATLVAETERMDRFVADLLELARLEADDFTVTMGNVDAGALVDATIRAWAARARMLDVTLIAEPAAASTLQTDPMRARQLIDGLIENALRAIPLGGTVIVARPEADAVEVRDSGPGLADDDLAHMFDRGVVRERYRDVRPVGTGLGLSIAARLADRLGATIVAGRAAEGGVAVRVRFPR